MTNEEMTRASEFFKQHQSIWVESHRRSWVWIHINNSGFVAQFYQTMRDAVLAAYAAGYDNVPIFVKEITDIYEEPFFANIPGFMKIF